MSIARIPDLGDRRIATKVLSDLSVVYGTEGVGKAENDVLSAYSMIKDSGEQVTELRLKEIVNAIATGEIEPQATPATPFQSDPNADFGDVNYQFSSGNFIQRNADRLAQGAGHAGLGQPYGTAGMDIDEQAGFGEQAIDALGAFTWNFADSLLLGLPGLALNKVVKPLVGESGFTDFLDGMRAVDTDAGIWGERLGVAGSFILPGGLLRGVGKAGVAVGKANLVGKVFGLGGKATRAATGFTGKVAKAGKAAGRLGDEALDVTSDIAKLQGRVKKLKTSRQTLRDQLKIAREGHIAGKKPITKDLVADFKGAFALNKAGQLSLRGQIKALESVGSKTQQVGKALGKGMRKGAGAYYNTRKGMTAKQITEAGAVGMKDVLKARVTANVRGELTHILGDERTADLILTKAYKALDDDIVDIVSGTKFIGEIFHRNAPMMKGLSERVGKILQNGVEEAIGFSTHSFLHETVKGLADTEDYDLDTLKEIASVGVESAKHSAVTAAVFATGGGIPFFNSAGAAVAVPMKLFAPTRKGDFKSFFKSMLGLNGHTATVFANSTQRYANTTRELEGMLKGMRQGLKGGTGGAMKKLRERGIIDYDRLAGESPEAIATILERIVSMERGALGNIHILGNAGGYAGRDGLASLTQRLRSAIGGTDTKLKRDLLQEATGFLKKQAEASIEMNWRSNFGAFKYDSIINMMTGASIFMGGGGREMLEGLARDETHMADIFTHALFSFTSASHGLHMIPGRSLGDPNIDAKLTASDRFLAETQNKGMMRALGLDAGAPTFFKNTNSVEDNPFVGDSAEMKKLRTHAETATAEEIDRMEIKPDGTNIEPSTQATVTDARTMLNHLRNVQVKFAEDSPYKVLNDVIAKDRILTDDQLLSDTSGIAKALARYASGVREELTRTGVVDEAMQYTVPITDSLLMDYANIASTGKVKVMRDIAENAFSDLQVILQRTGKKIGAVELGDLKGIEVEGIDNGLARFMMNRLLDVSHTMGMSIRDHSQPVTLTKEQAPAVLELLKRYSDEISNQFGGAGLDSVNLSRGLDAYVRSGYATAGKAVYVDNAKLPVLHKDETIGVAGKEDIHTLATRAGFLKYQGDNIPVVRHVDTKALEEAGFSVEQGREVRNFMDILKASFGFKVKVGKALTKGEAELFYKQKTKLDHLDTDVSLRDLTIGMGTDFSNNYTTSDMEYHIMRAVTSKISPEKYAGFTLLKKLGLIYEDATHGRVALRLTAGEDGVSVDDSLIKAIENLGTRHELRVKTKDAQGKEISQSPFEDYINNELKPLIEELTEIGVINGYAPKGSYARFGGHVDPETMGKKLLEIAEGRRIMTDEQAKLQVGELIKRLNEIDSTRKLKDFDYGKIKLLQGKIINLLGKRQTSAYDWAQVSRIVKEYGVFADKELNEQKFREAMDKVEEFIRDKDYVDSVIEEWQTGAREAKLDDYDWIIGHEKNHAFTLSKLLGSEGLDFEPEVRNAVVMDIRKAARAGREAFASRIDGLYKEGNNTGFRRLNREEFNALFTSLSGSRAIKRYTLGDHFKNMGLDSEGLVFGKESSTLVEDIALPEGYITRMSENLGLEVGLLSGSIKRGDTTYSFFKKHDGATEKAKVGLLNNFRSGTHDQIVQDPTAANNWRIESTNTRRAVLTMGDLGNFAVFDLPSTELSAKRLAVNIDKILERHDGTIGGKFSQAYDSLTAMRNLLAEGNYKKAFANNANVNKSFRFIMLHEMLGVAGMEKVHGQIGSDSMYGTISRFRQMHSRQFTPLNREAFESVLGTTGAVGYKDGQLKGIVLSDENLSNVLGILEQGGVSRGDGQVWFHSSVLDAQGRAHGYEGSHGVIKNMIIDRDMVSVRDASGNIISQYNNGTFLTKNAGAVNPEMDRLMESLGVSFISTTSAVKLEGSRSTGRMIGADGGDVTITDYLNGKSVTGMEGDFKVALESLRFNKVPHESEATIGYQIENMLRSDIVQDLSSAYYNSKFEGAGGLFNLSTEIFEHGPDGRAKLRQLVRRQLDSSRFSEKIDLNSEFTGSSISNAYLEAGPYGSPGDFWFAPRALSVLKKGVMQNAIFKTKESSGRQDILAADMKGILNTHEGVMAYDARELTMQDAFDGTGDFGFNFAFKLEGENVLEQADALNRTHFGWKGKSYFNRMAVGDGSSVEAELGKSSYIHARLFRVKDLGKAQPINGRESFVVSALRQGLVMGKKDGVFKSFQGMDPNSQEFLRTANALNNYVIDSIEGSPMRLNSDILQSIPPAILQNLNLAATKAATRSGKLGQVSGDGHHKIGRVMDAVGIILGDYNYHARRAGSTQGKQSITWGLAGLNQRYPSARPNDTLPMVFLGSLSKKMGNQVMLNYYDSTLKGEADYDIDNYNYWFKTPKSHLAEANRLRSIAGINKTDGPRKKSSGARAEGLDPFNEEDMMEYSRSQERASFLRGITIKGASLVEKMVKDKMRVDFRHKNGDFRLVSKFGSLTEALDNDQGVEAFMHASKMVQEIIDSKKGLLAEKYMDEGFDPFVDVLKKFYKVQQINQDGSVRVDDVVWDSDYSNIARSLISPYSKLLSFSKKSWVGDATESMTWDQMRDIVINWDSVMGKNHEANLEESIADYIGDKRISNIKVSMERTRGMAEDAATKILKLDDVVSTGETSELFGKKAADITELSRYLAEGNNWSDTPTPDQVLRFVSEINTKNWNVRQALNKRKMLFDQIKYSNNLASKGDHYHTRRTEMLTKQLSDVSRVLEAINQGKIEDPQIMHKFADAHEAEKAFKNTISVEAIKLMIAKRNVDPGILKAMEAEAIEIQKKRGILWAKELNSMMKGHLKVYDEARDIEIRNMVQEYLNRWYANAPNFGESAYDPAVAILALAKPQLEGAYTSNGNKRYGLYKNVPADLFNMAVQLSFKSRPSQMKEFFNDMGKTYAVADQYMRGRSAELSELMRIQELRDNTSSLLGVASRYNARNEEMVSRAQVLRNLGYTQENISRRDVIGNFFGVDLRAMELIGNRTPQDLLNENISIVQRRAIQPAVVRDLQGVEHELSPLIRVDITSDAYLSDTDGIAFRHAEKTLKDKAMKDGIEFDPKEAATRERILKEIDRMHGNMHRVIRDKGEVEPSKVTGGGGPEETLRRKVEKRSGRKANHEAEGICK